MILRFNQFIAESDTYDNKFVGKSDKTNWSQEDIDFIEGVKVEPFTEKEIEIIKNLYSERFKEREDLIVEVKPYSLFSDDIDRISIDIYIKRKGRKKPDLNSTTFITKLSDEYFWIELKNKLTHNTYNFKCDTFNGLIETLKKV